MAKLTIVYWRDIPAQVIVKKGRKSAKIQLTERFEQAIDRCAMRVGAKDADAYLADWRRGEPIECSEDLELEAKTAADNLEAEYDSARLKELIEASGKAA